MYEIRVDQGTGSDQTTYYFGVIVCNRTDFKDAPNDKTPEPIVMPPETATALPTTSRIYVNGVETQLEAYNINGNNFFKLRDLGILADFYVGWNAETRTVEIRTDKEYDHNS